MKITSPRSLALVGAVAAALALTGCSTDAGGASTDAGTESLGAVAMGFPTADVTIWNDQLAIMRPIIEEAGYELLTEDSQFDVNRQVSTWTAWINRGDVKAIAGYPVNIDAMIPVTAAATAAGIPVFGYLVNWEGTSGTTLVDAYQGGFDLAANAAAELLEQGRPDDLTVILVGSRDSDLGVDVYEGLTDGFASIMPDANIVEQTALSREEGYNLVKAQLTADPESYVWLGGTSDPILGVYQGLLDSGFAPDDENFYLASRDATNEVLDFITIPNSIYRTSLVVPAKALAEANAALLIAGASGKPTVDIVVDGVMVTAENADEFYVAE